MSAEPQQAVPEAIADITEALRVNVTSMIRSALVLCLRISDKDSGSEEEALPIPKIKGLKSGNPRTADTSILRKVVWPHKVVYTSTGRPGKYD